MISNKVLTREDIPCFAPMLVVAAVLIVVYLYTTLLGLMHFSWTGIGINFILGCTIGAICWAFMD